MNNNIIKKENTYYQEYQIGNRNVTKIDLVNQDYTHIHSDAEINHHTLSIPLYHIYESQNKEENQNGMGKGWRSNLHQYLIKKDYNEETQSREIHYIDGKGKKHTFEEKWYYEDNGEKHYVNRDAIFIDNDQRLKVIDNKKTHEVKIECENKKERLFLILGNNLGNFYHSEDFIKTKSYYIELANGYKRPCVFEDGIIKVPQFVDENGTLLSYKDVIYDDNGYKHKLTNKSVEFSIMDKNLYFDSIGLFFKNKIANGEEKIYLKNENIYQQNEDKTLEDIYLTEDIQNVNIQIEQIEEALKTYGTQLDTMYKNIEFYNFNKEQEDIHDLDEFKKRVKDARNAITEAIEDSDSKARQKSYDNANDNLEEVSNEYSDVITEKRKSLDIESYDNSFNECLKSLNKLEGFKEKRQALIEEQRKQVNDFIIDENGNSLGFDGYGRLILIQDKDENKIQMEYGYGKENEGQMITIYSETEIIQLNYDKNTGLLNSMVDSQGRKTKYSYDSNENLVSVIYNDQKETKFDYENSFSIISSMLEKTKITEMVNEIKVIGYCYSEDEINQDTNFIGNEELKVIFEHHYTFNEMTVTFKDSLLDEEKSYTFDEKGRITQQKSNKETSLFAYENDNLIQEAHYQTNEDYSFISSAIIYPDAGFATLFIDSLKLKSKSLAFKMDLSDSLIQNLTDFKGTFKITILETNQSFEYPFTNEKTFVIPFWVNINDAKNFRIELSTFNADKEINPVTLCDISLVEPKEETIYEYDTENRIVLKKNQEETIEFLDYDEDDWCHQVRTTDKYNEKVNIHYSYSANKQLTLVEDSKGNVEEYSYDEKGNCIEKRNFNKKDASLVKIEILNRETNKKDKIFRQYDKNTGELLSISSNSKGMNNATSFTYNYGLLTSMMHHGMKVSYTYDGQGRKTKVKIQNTPFINISYSDNVDINESSLSLKNANKVITTQNGYKVESLCDKNGQLRKQNLNDETSVLYTYDKKNRLIQTTFSDNTPNESIIYEEDKVKEITKGTFTHSYTYDEKDRILYEQEKENQNLLNEKTYFYENDELTKILINEIPIYYQHDVFYRITHQEINYKNVELCHEYSYVQQDGSTIDWIAQDFVKVKARDENNQPILLTETHHYEYDDKGNITSIDTDDQLTRYQYDSLNRLVREDNPILNQTIVYKYDSGGNILLKKTYDYSLEEKLFSPTVDEYAYQCNGWKDQLVSFNGKSFNYDSMGRPTTYKDISFTWNINGTLSKIGDNITYTYNAKKVRTKKVVNGVDTSFLLDGTRIIKTTTNNVDIIYRYVLNKLVGFCYNNIEFIYERNILGDIVRIHNSETGTIVGEYAYDSYGNHSIIKDVDGIATLNPFRYRGYFFDSESNLYYLNSRYYDPEVGRFISPDIISILDETKGQINGLNLYCYCRNNPIMYADPTGHFAISTFLISLAIGALVNWGLSEIFDSQIAGGISSVVGGGTAISTGISLCAFGSWGIAVGILLMAIGAGTVVFGTNEIMAGVTGANYILQWTGMGDELYSRLYIGLNIASSVGSIAGNIGMRFASTAKLNAVMKNPEIIQKYSRFQFKTYARYSNQWTLMPSKNGKGMRALSLINKGNSIRYGYGINNAEHYFGAYYWVVANGIGKYRFPFI